MIDLAGEERPLAPGDAVFIPGDTWHAAWSEGEEPLRLVSAAGAITGGKTFIRLKITRAP